MATEKLFTRTGAAKQAGCSYRTLINYERRKIIQPKRLDSGGRPIYSHADVATARRVYRDNVARTQTRLRSRSSAAGAVAGGLP